MKMFTGTDEETAQEARQEGRADPDDRARAVEERCRGKCPGRRWRRTGRRWRWWSRWLRRSRWRRRWWWLRRRRGWRPERRWRPVNSEQLQRLCQRQLWRSDRATASSRSSPYVDIRKTYVDGSSHGGPAASSAAGRRGQPFRPVIVHALTRRLRRLLSKASTPRSWGPRARARARCSTCSAASTDRPAANTWLAGQRRRPTDRRRAIVEVRSRVRSGSSSSRIT